ncbi:ribosome maturation factor RimP [Candidatus Endowatersipora endosymbiont of Watersipora subatra]|uniref:ribosome maturation factor RimP n=1 Tax=Candidatus Endowatersipora endosymbiont of Watersipora subatra TaxID=3077946 RepID=UPI00312CADE9
MPILNCEEFRLVKVNLFDHNGKTLQIMAEKLDGTMSIEDCEKLSNVLSSFLDIEDPLPYAYNLEISSPGIDRPLVRKSDFERWVGYDAEIETEYFLFGRKIFFGTIVGLKENHVVINIINGLDKEHGKVTLPIESIARARLVFTDSLITESFQREKALRKANEADRES